MKKEQGGNDFFKGGGRIPWWAAGISIYASFVFGFDYDTEESFAKNLEFCHKHKFFVSAFNHLLAFPNTNTYRRFEEEKRLMEERAKHLNQKHLQHH